MIHDWEGCANAFLRAIGADDAHHDPRLLAAAYDLELVPVGGRDGRASCTRGRRVYLPVAAAPERQAGVIAHELGHLALEMHGGEQSEPAASYTGAAILVPRRPLLRALRRHGPDLAALRPLFPHASAELLARRVADVAEYVCTIVDERGVRRHAPLVFASLSDALTPDERWLVDRAREAGRAHAAHARAWHVRSPLPQTIVLANVR